MSICLLVIGQIDLFVLKVSFSVCTSPNIQNETLFLRFKIFLINFGIYKCHSSGITVLCIEGARSGCRYAYSQGVQHGADIAVHGFAVIEKRERHTAVGRVPENGKTRYQGRQRPDGTPDRE